jgi:preprotein translocase SecE subunit
MISFIKNSLRELKHVVWPTKEETRNYFLVVLIILIVFGLYLFFASTLFSEAMLYLK